MRTESNTIGRILLIISVVVFGLIHLTPGDPVNLWPNELADT